MDPFTLETFEGYFGRPREKLYADLYGENKEEAKGHFEAYVLKNHLQQLQPMPGAGSLMEVIRQKALSAGIVSNKKSSFIAEEIRHFGWSDIFLSVVGAGEAPEDKPSPAPLLLALEKGQVKAPMELIWYVGDTETDILCAQAAGCVSVFIENNEEKGRIINEYSPHLTFRNCEEFKDFLLQYTSNTLQKTY